MTAIDINARLAELHVQLAAIHGQIAAMHRRLLYAAPSAPEPAAEALSNTHEKIVAPVAQSTSEHITPAPASDATVKSTNKGCAISAGGSSALIKPGKLMQLADMLDRGVFDVIHYQKVCDYLSAGHSGYRRCAPTKRPRVPRGPTVMALMRRDHVVIGAGEDRVTLSLEAAQELEKTLRVEADKRERRRDEAEQRARDRFNARGRAGCAAVDAEISRLKHVPLRDLMIDLTDDTSTRH